MKNHRLFKCLVLGALAIGTFGVAMFAHQQPQVIEEAVAWATPQTPNVTNDYYSACDGLTGDALKTELGKFNKPKSPNYDWCLAHCPKSGHSRKFFGIDLGIAHHTHCSKNEETDQRNIQLPGGLNDLFFTFYFFFFT